MSIDVKENVFYRSNNLVAESVAFYNLFITGNEQVLVTFWRKNVTTLSDYVYATVTIIVTSSYLTIFYENKYFRHQQLGFKLHS